MDLQKRPHSREKVDNIRHVCPSVRLPAFSNAVTAGQISVKLHIGDFEENPQRISKIG